MKFSPLFITASIAATATTQSQSGPSLSGLPVCAQNAALQGASSSGCQLSDAKCFCLNNVFIGGLQGAISTLCSGDDQITACKWGNELCGQYGLSLPCLSTKATAVPGQIGSQSDSNAGSTGGGYGSSIFPTGTASLSAISLSNSTATVTSTMRNSSNTTWSSTFTPTYTRDSIGSQYTGAASSAVLMQSDVLALMVGIVAVFALN